MSREIEDINEKLATHFSKDDTGRPIFRVVWANEQTEKRRVDTLDSGIQLLHPEVREVKKYPYLKDLFVLERLVVVPDQNRQELPVDVLSYEPLWAFVDDKRNPVRPTWEGCKFIVDTLYAALGKKSMRKYVEDPDEPEKRVQRIHDELFGNESTTTDALRYREGVVVPNNYKE